MDLPIISSAAYPKICVAAGQWIRGPISAGLATFHMSGFRIPWPYTLQTGNKSILLAYIFFVFPRNKARKSEGRDLKSNPVSLSLHDGMGV